LYLKALRYLEVGKLSQHGGSGPELKSGLLNPSHVI
jgi:hypothetical protein